MEAVMMTLRPLALLAALAAGAAAALPPPAGAVVGDGALAAVSSVCDVTLADVRLGMERVRGPLAGMMVAWSAQVQASAGGCPVAAASCTGVGALRSGVVLQGCGPLGGGGTLGPVVVCTPGPGSQGPLVRGSADFAFHHPLGAVEGRMALVLLGDAADEVPDVCV